MEGALLFLCVRVDPFIVAAVVVVVFSSYYVMLLVVAYAPEHEGRLYANIL